MKTHRATAAAVLLFSLGAAASEQTASLKIQGWHSKGDALKAEAMVKAMTGVKNVTTDVQAKTLTVVFDDAAVTQARLIKAIEGAGYTVAK